MKVKIDSLKKQVIKVLSSRFNVQESQIIADYLLWAEMSGNNTQGILKMSGTEPIQNVIPKSAIKVERETKLSQLINAGQNPAPLVLSQATDVAIKKAKEHGFGIVGVHNTKSSSGAQAYYVEKIAKEGLIGICCSSAPGSVAPYGGIDPLFGTNPIGFAFPTLDEPLVFDMATSAMTWYGLVLAKTNNTKIPHGVAIDKDGNPTDDPELAMGGALLPFDKSYKGSGLSMMIEVLAGPLVNADYCDMTGGEWGSVIIAIDPELLVDQLKFRTNCSDLINKVKHSRKQKGHKEIRIPGEQSRKLYKECVKSGYVNVDEEVIKSIEGLSF